MIRNAKDFGLDQSPATLPDVSGAIMEWFQKLSFNLITKTNVDFQLVEVEVPTTAFGVRQPASPQMVQLLPEGQRKWKYETIHALPDLIMSPDDICVFASVRYRVMSKTDWKEYGYVEYYILEDVQ
jgi:hypothetical protein